MGFPLGCGSSLALGCVTGQSRVNIVHVFCFGQGVRVTFGGGWVGRKGAGHPLPLDPSTVLRVSGPTLGDGFRLSGAGMTGGGVRLDVLGMCKEASSCSR